MSTNSTKRQNGIVRESYIHSFRDEFENDYIYRTTDETVHIVYRGRRRQVLPLDPPSYTIEHLFAQVADDRDIWRVDLHDGAGDALAAQLEEI